MMRLILLSIAFLFSLVAASQEEIDWVTIDSPHDVAESEKGHPFAFANEIEAGFTTENSGSLTTYSDGTYIWRLGITSAKAKSLHVTVAASMSVGEIFSVSSVDGSNLQTYDYSNFSSKNTLMTLPVDGDSIIVEYRGFSDADCNFCVTEVGVGSFEIPWYGNKASAGQYGSSLSCETDASCYDDIKDVKQSVCRLIIKCKTSGGTKSYYGTGVLVNNTARDRRPLIVTAAHVINGDFVSATATFNDETPMCQDIAPTTTTIENVQSTKLLKYVEKRDLCIIELDAQPSARSNPYWAGWRLNTDVEGPFFCIHHPNGDVRKASFAESVVPYTDYTAAKTNSGNVFDPGNHWKVPRWISGTTEGGSSGSGLFDSDMLLIGNLTGGYANCTNPNNDFYSMLCNNMADVVPFLDPLGSNAEVISGEYLNSESLQTAYSINNGLPIDCNEFENGYLAGHNDRKTSAIAQRFDIGRAELKAVYVAPKKVESVNRRSIEIIVWSGDDKPENILYSTTVSNINLSAGKQTRIQFDKPVVVDGSFYVGARWTYDEPIDKVAFYHQVGQGGLFYIDDSWKSASQLGLPLDVSLFFGIQYNKSGEINSVNRNTVVDNIFRIGRNLYRVDADFISRVEIYSIEGKLIHVDEPRSSEAFVSLESMPLGIYVVKVISQNHNVQTYKLAR